MTCEGCEHAIAETLAELPGVLDVKAAHATGDVDVRTSDPSQRDAIIKATYAEDDAPITFTIRDGQVHHPEAVVHLLVPFQNWYDDMVFT